MDITVLTLLCLVCGHAAMMRHRTNGFLKLQTSPAQRENLAKIHNIKRDFGVSKHGRRRGGIGINFWTTFNREKSKKKTTKKEKEWRQQEQGL